MPLRFVLFINRTDRFPTELLITVKNSSISFHFPLNPLHLQLSKMCTILRGRKVDVVLLLPFVIVALLLCYIVSLQRPVFNKPSPWLIAAYRNQGSPVYTEN